MNISLTKSSFKPPRNIIVFILIFTSLFFSSCTNVDPDAPWPNAKVYSDSSQLIKVRSGEQFIIKFAMEYNLLPVIKQIYDTNFVILIDRKLNFTDEPDGPPAYSWFLFKSLKEGETQISIQHFTHLVESLINQETFTVEIK